MNASAAAANVQRFLLSHGLSLETIIAYVDAAAPDGAVLLGGSVPQGLANRDSDIDLLLMAEQHPPSPRVLQYGEAEHVFTHTAQPVKIHLRSLTFGYLEVIAGRMQDALGTFRDPGASTRIHVFGENELNILHQIRTGVCLRMPAFVVEWRERLCSAYLPHYLMIFSLAEHFSRREDAIGEMREGRTESAAWAVREALSHLACAVLASVDESHPSPKWRVRLLQLRRTEIGTELADTLVARLTLPRWEDFDAYLRDAIEFADTVIESILIRRAELLPVLMELQNDIRVRTHLDESDPLT
jgi:Nucleotidyltransferase domain